jgi:hypothetical protein
MRESMQTTDPLEAVRAVLAQWGRWVRQGHAGVAPYRCPLGMLRGGGVVLPAITDDVALQVDAAVLALKARMPQVGHAVELYYSRHGITYEQVARLMRINSSRARRDVRDLVLAGEHWLDARLHSIIQ